MSSTVQELINCIWTDQMPGFAARIDFGINSQKIFGALQYGLRHMHFIERDLEKAVCNGPALTKLVDRPDNPYGNGLTIKTIWDDMPEEE